jgi:hypothetical protein
LGVNSTGPVIPDPWSSHVTALTDPAIDAFITTWVQQHSNVLICDFKSTQQSCQ